MIHDIQQLWSKACKRSPVYITYNKERIIIIAIEVCVCDFTKCTRKRRKWYTI